MNSVNTGVAKVKKLHPDAKYRKGSNGAAGIDLYAYTDKDIAIQPGTTVKISTGLSFTPPVDHFGAIFARSGMATNRGLRPANCVG